MRKLAIYTGLAGGVDLIVLLTTNVDHAGGGLPLQWRGLLNVTFAVLATVATVATMADGINRRADDRIRAIVADVVRDQIHDALADAYRTATIVTAGSAPSLRAVHSDN